MGVADRSRAHVEEVLSALEASYEGFPVNQTSVTVPPPQYERVSDRCRDGTARFDVHVRNDRGEVLVLDDQDGPAVPSVAVHPDDTVADRAREAVRARTGVEFALEGVIEATIAGVRDQRAPDEMPVYRLIAQLAGQHVTGAPGGDGYWTADPPTPALLR